MDELKRLQYLKGKSAERQREADQLQGRLDALTGQLAEFGCKTEKQAQKMLRKKLEEKEQVREQLDQLLSQFEEEFANELE